MDACNPVTVINPTGRSDWLLVCEHAGNQVPDSLNQLGLADDYLHQHIAYDIGAYEATLALSKKLDATAIVGHYSRLVIDCNRPLSATDCITTISDGIVIPGNQHLSQADKLQRIENIYHPFHRCITDILTHKIIANPATKLANIHSFTPMLASEGKLRPWDIGFIYRNQQISKDLVHFFAHQMSYIVGDNEPYNGFIYKGYTVPTHADAQDIPSFLVEFRQDLINHTDGVEHWTALLVEALSTINVIPPQEGSNE